MVLFAIDDNSSVILIRYFVRSNSFDENGFVVLISVPLAEEFLKREWLGQDGQREKGSKFNEQLQFVIRCVDFTEIHNYSKT